MGDLATGILVGLSVSALVLALAWLWRRFGYTDARQARLLASQYEVMMASGVTEISSESLDSPVLALSRREFRQIEAIEAELIHDSDAEVAIRLLHSFLTGNDPWVAARAAWALYRWDSVSALDRLRTLLKDRSPYVQLPAIWALGQLGTPTAVTLLIESVDHHDSKTHRAVLRSLVQISTQKKLSAETSAKIEKVFSETRARAGWVL